MFAIAEEPDGTLWFGTRGGLSRFTKDRFRTYTRKDDMPNDDVGCLHTARGGVWVGTNGGGLGRFKGATFAWHDKQEGLARFRRFWRMTAGVYGSAP